MTWTKLSDNYPDVTFDLSHEAFRLDVAALVFCNRLLTDGLVPANRLAGLAPLESLGEVVAELIRAGRWEATQSGYRLLHFFPDQLSRARVLEERAKAAERQRIHRHGVTDGVTRSVTGPVTADVGHAAPYPSSPVPAPLPIPEGNEVPLAKVAPANGHWGSGWADWNDPCLLPFRKAWAARGFRHPPTGAPDERAGQRAHIYQIATARPDDLAKWVGEPPPRTQSYEVVAHLFRRWDEIQVGAPAR